MRDVKIIELMLTAVELLLSFVPLAAAAGQQADAIDAREMFFSIKDLVREAPEREGRVTLPPGPRLRPPAPDHRAPQRKVSDRKTPEHQGLEHTIDVVPNPLGLRYSLLLRDTAKQFVAISPDKTFRSGDLIRVSVKSNQRAYLYIIQRGSSGEWNMLFPDARIDAGNNLIEPGRPVEIPGGRGEVFRIEDPPGEEKLFILLTRAPESDLDKLIASLRQGESHGPERPRTASPVRIADSVVDQIRSQIGERDLVFTKFDDGDDERAVYVVNKAAGGSDARVTVDLTIQHR